MNSNRFDPRGVSPIVGHLARERPPNLPPPSAAGWGGSSTRSAFVPPSGVNIAPNLLRALQPIAPNHTVPLRLDVSKVCAINSTTGVAFPPLVNVEFHTPSPKLAAKVGIMFLANGANPDASNNDATLTWQLTPLIFVKDANRYAQGQLVFRSPTAPLTAQARVLPDAYEVDTTVERILASVILAGANDANHIGGTWYATASWEPRNASMSDAERGQLFALCDIVCGAPVNVLSGT